MKKAGKARGLSDAVGSVDLTGILGHAASLFRYQVQARGVAFELDLPKDALPVRGEAYPLQRAFYRILLGMVQLTVDSPEASGISLRCRCDDDLARVRISICMTDSSEQPARKGLGRRFKASAETAWEHWPGAEKTISAYGGSVEVSAGEGLEVVVTLCTASALSPERCADSLCPTPSAGSVLIVDDEEMTCHVIGQMLEHLGHEVVCITSPSEAAELLRSRAFDLVMIDFNMPGINGDVLIRKVLDSLGAATVVLTTGDSALDPVVEIGGRSVAVLKKPFGMKDLRCLTEKAGN